VQKSSPFLQNYFASTQREKRGQMTVGYNYRVHFNLFRGTTICIVLYCIVLYCIVFKFSER